MEISKYIDDLNGRKSLTEDEVKQILVDYEIPTTKFSVMDPGSEFLAPLGEYPLVMKVCSSDILHKTDVGGVVLNIQNETEARSAFADIRSRFPNDKILIENMEKPGLELIMGIIRDPSFGLSIMVGLGGIFAEALKDVSFRIIPISEYDARAMVDDLRSSKVLDGFRGMTPNKDLVYDILLKLSGLGEDFHEHLSQMDLNPVIIGEDSAVVVDAKMIFK